MSSYSLFVGKVFPGNLHFTLTFQPEMSNPNSAVFHKTANDIIAKVRHIPLPNLYSTCLITSSVKHIGIYKPL